ncbi:transmembrane protein [Cystoisospora suis]|uniref:Transmembrane protein n=1 Tax=Cystoisospora suis TaxID=483139 RepID=A0A2C6LGS9_9APIC|nr:transmembrane protein [Cystoisospora suis]
MASGRVLPFSLFPMYFSRRCSSVFFLLSTCVFPFIFPCFFHYPSLSGRGSFGLLSVKAEEPVTTTTTVAVDSSTTEVDLEHYLPEDRDFDLKEELKADLERIKRQRDASSTTTTKAPPQNIVLDAGKEVGMGVWHAFTAPFRLVKNLVVHPRRTISAAAASAGVTFSKLGTAVRASIQGDEGAGRAWREAGRDFVRAATMHPDRERDLHKVAALASAEQAHQNVVHMRSSSHDQAVADERLKHMLGYNESKSEEIRKEVEQQRQRYLRYQDMLRRGQEEKKARGQGEATEESKRPELTLVDHVEKRKPFEHSGNELAEKERRV